MNHQLFYNLALYAMRVNPEDLIYIPQPDGSVKWNLKPGIQMLVNSTPVILRADGVAANSDEEARQLGMMKFMEAYPLEEGWVNHHVAVRVAEALHPDGDCTICDGVRHQSYLQQDEARELIM
jgi:hypothetical protein